MNFIIENRQPETQYNTVLSFPDAEKRRYAHLHWKMGYRLVKGIQEHDGTTITWKMNCSNSEIEFLCEYLKDLASEATEAHAFNEYIFPSQPKQLTP